MIAWVSSSPPWLAPVASFVVTLAVLTVLLRRLSHRVLDYPNERSLHQKPVPRTGSIGVIAGLGVALPFITPASWWPMWLGGLLLIAVSFADDLAGVPIVWRFATHVAAAVICVTGLFGGVMGGVWSGALILAMVWMTNLYNFMDGMDGLAGGMALIGFGFFAGTAWWNGHPALALSSACVAASAGAFLLFNFHPARIFLGDAGSTSLGFLAAAFGAIGWQEGVWSLWFPLLVFAPFIVDATATLAQRAARGEQFWQAHRSHYYQRLALAGWGHRRTVLVEYGLMLVCGGLAILYEVGNDSQRMGLLGVWAMVCLAFMVGVRIVERRERCESC
jgi:UDP-N-acetylmuramyl pentapeptide phosphotransferase/UDP-N-acetylglucosamine-1-phosphate transferase